MNVLKFFTIISLALFMTACNEKTVIGENCREIVKPDDPNETPHRLCDGPGGWKLLVERVESGRSSLSLMAPDQTVLQLDLQKYVSRGMMSLGPTAEWRVETKNGASRPVALLVYVETREDIENPEQVTHSFAVISKNTPDTTCITDVIAETADSKDMVKKAFETAHLKPCADEHRQNGTLQ